jgi:predicted membrane-bound dolichyl-phosphate-mannose-protein mannosyltransferase
MFRRPQMVWRRRHLSPQLLLALLLLTSVVARAALLGQPCRTPCRSVGDHVLVFDEDYYVNAARVIAGIHLPPAARYASAPAGSDPNAEHPQLAKLIIAGSIELFGDGPFAWRLGSLVFGTLAILGMYALARSAGAGRWLALGTAALMATDNLLLVHGRIGTLDVYVLAAMLWAAVLYLRGRPLVAGTVIGVGACFKLVAPYLLLGLLILELLRRRAPGAAPRAGLRSLAICIGAAVIVFVGLLSLLDVIARPYDPVTAHFVTGGPFSHLSHMLSYAAGQSSPNGPHGIASYPWEWLVDYKPIVYLNINPAEPAPGLYGIHPASHFLGMINPPVMLLALPAVLVAVGSWWRRSERGPGRELDSLAVAWFAGTFAPFVVLSLCWHRTSYLYYMTIVMPGIYLAVARLVERARIRRWLIWAWVTAVVAGAIVLYPFTPLP